MCSLGVFRFFQCMFNSCVFSFSSYFLISCFLNFFIFIFLYVLLVSSFWVSSVLFSALPLVSVLLSRPLPVLFPPPWLVSLMCVVDISHLCLLGCCAPCCVSVPLFLVGSNSRAVNVCDSVIIAHWPFKINPRKWLLHQQWTCLYTWVVFSYVLSQ